MSVVVVLPCLTAVCIPVLGTFRELVDINFVSAMGPPGGGRNPVTPRFLRHFNHLSFTELEDESKHRIFATILRSWLGRALHIHLSIVYPFDIMGGCSCLSCSLFPVVQSKNLILEELLCGYVSKKEKSSIIFHIFLS